MASEQQRAFLSQERLTQDIYQRVLCEHGQANGAIMKVAFDCDGIFINDAKKTQEHIMRIAEAKKRGHLYTSSNPDRKPTITPEVSKMYWKYPDAELKKIGLTYPELRTHLNLWFYTSGVSPTFYEHDIEFIEEGVIAYHAIAPLVRETCLITSRTDTDAPKQTAKGDLPSTIIFSANGDGAENGIIAPLHGVTRRQMNKMNIPESTALYSKRKIEGAENQNKGELANKLYVDLLIDDSAENGRDFVRIATEKGRKVRAIVVVTPYNIEQILKNPVPEDKDIIFTTLNHIPTVVASIQKEAIGNFLPFQIDDLKLIENAKNMLKNMKLNN